MWQKTVSEQNVETLSKMSRFFRILMKFGLFPFMMDSSEKKLSFKICSRPTLYFTLYVCIMMITFSFCMFYLLGIDNIQKFWENMLNQSNFTDFLTYAYLMSINMFSTLQLKIFYDISKISSDLLLSTNFKWPKHGHLLLYLTILCMGAQIIWGVLSINARIEMNFSELLGVIIGYCILFVMNYTIVFNEFIFFLTWMEHFSKICDEYDFSNVFKHSQACLKIFKTIQDGLGWIYLMFFIAFQIMIVMNIYMFISTAFFGPYDLHTNIVISICYVIIFLYCAVVLYVLTTTAENTYRSLQNLTNPLRRMMDREN